MGSTTKKDEAGTNNQRTDKNDRPEVGKPEVDTAISVPKDGGWGWFVALGAFISHVLAGGFDRSGGVFYLKFLDRYGGSAAGTAWVIALFSSFRLLFGPLVSAMVNRYTGRAVVFCGALLSVASLIISGYTTSLISIYFSYGVVTGFCSSMTFSPGIIMVGQYFNKRRRMAVGLVTVGAGIGSCLLPPFTQFLFETYGFKGTFLLLSGIMSHYLVVSALYRPLALHRRLRSKDMQVVENCATVYEEPRSTAKDRQVVVNGVSVYEEPQLTVNDMQVVGDGATEYGEPLLAAPNGTHKLLKTISDDNQVFGSVEYIYSTPKATHSALSVVSIEHETLTKNKSERILNLSLLRDFVYVCVCFQSFLFLLSYYITVTFLPAMVKGRGLTVLQGSTLMSVMGICDAMSRALSSVLLELECVKSRRRIAYNGLAYTAVIISTLLPSMREFWQFAILCAIYGCISGVHSSQYYMIAVDVVGPENISSCVGIALGFNGLSGLVAPAIGGLLKDSFGTYSPAFYFGSGGLFLSGSIMALGNTCFHRRNKRPTK